MAPGTQAHRGGRGEVYCPPLVAFRLRRTARDATRAFEAISLVFRYRNPNIEH